MPRYAYTAKTRGGEVIRSTGDAASLPALAAGLVEDGYQIVSANPALPRVSRVRGIPFFEIIAVYRQIASSIEAGLPLAETLQMLSGETRNSRLKSLMYFLKAEVGSGRPFSEALKEFPNIFPDVHVAVIRAGEESGRLGQSLDELANQAETFSNMNRRFASALVYPAVVSVVALALMNFLFLNIVPRFKDLFGDLGVKEYSFAAGLVFGMAKIAVPATALLLIAALFLVSLIVTQRRAASGRLWLDQWRLRIPVLGQIVEKASLARFSGTLGLLLDSGVDLPRAVRMAAGSAGNRSVERLLRNLSAEVEMGHSLSNAMTRSNVMPSALVWRIGVGEETGALPDALVRMSRLYSSQVDSLVTSLAGIIEPVLIIILGTAVAALVFGLFIPLAAVLQGLTAYTG